MSVGNSADGIHSYLNRIEYVTSDHRIAGSSPAGCKASLGADLRVKSTSKKSKTKSAVIRLLSCFPVLLTPSSNICADNGAHFKWQKRPLEPPTNPRVTLKLLQRDSEVISDMMSDRMLEPLPTYVTPVKFFRHVLHLSYECGMQLAKLGVIEPDATLDDGRPS